MIVAGIGPDDEVICPSLSYIATANAIKYTGAKPVFAEINPANYNLDVADVENTDKCIKRKLFCWFIRLACRLILTDLPGTCC